MTRSPRHTQAAEPLTVHSRSDEETVAAASEFARRLRPGDLVALYGDLGAGKTRFVRGICLGLGTGRPVSSPTFTILHEYPSSGVSVYHFDFYRITSAAELREIGFQEYLSDERGICVIEWADRVEEYLPPGGYEVRLGMGRDPDCRTITIRRRDGGAK